MDSRLLSLVAMGATAVSVLVLSAIAGLPGLMLIPVVVLGLALVNHPRVLLVVYWCFLLLTPSLEVLLPGVIVKVLEQGGSLLVFVLLAVDLLLVRRALPGVKAFSFLVFLLLVNVGLSTLANKSPVVQVFYWTLIYLRPIAFFYFCIRHCSGHNLPAFVRLFVVSVAIQILFNALAYAGWNPLPYIIGRSFVDFSVGTHYSSNIVGYFMIAAVFCLCAFFLQGRRGVGGRLAAVVAMLLVSAQFYLTFTAHAYPILAAGLLLQLGMLRSKVLVHALRWLLPIVLLGALVLLLDVRGPMRHAAQQIITPSKLDYEWTRARFGAKGNAYEEVFLHASKHLPYPLLGGGPGNYTSTIAFMNHRPLAWLEHMSYHAWAFDQYRVSGGSIMTLPHTGFITMFGELGPVGFVLYWGLYGFAVLRVWRQFFGGLYVDRRQHALACAFVPMALGFVSLNILADFALSFQLAGGLWLWAAMVWNPFREEAAAGDGAPGPVVGVVPAVAEPA